MKNYQVAIIGGGPAGYSAAEKAGKAGLNVILFEKKDLGGVCLNEGCIPTKTLLYSAKLYDYSKEFRRFALQTENTTFDFKRIIARKNKVVRKLVLGVKAKMQEAKVDIIEGEATILDHNTILCNGEKYSFENLLVCTGSHTFVPPISGVQTIAYWTHEDALSTKEQPDSLIIVGGGVIGLEFASFYNSLGTKVTVVEMMDEILPGMDKEVVEQLRNEYTKKGIEFLVNTKVEAFSQSENYINVTISQNNTQSQIVANKVLLSVGRKANLSGFGLENLEIDLNEKGLPILTKQLQSSIPHIFICGDSNGKSLLAHTAIREAEVAINTILKEADEMSYEAIPGIVYTNPEIAGVGQTEETLQAKNIDYYKKVLPMTFSGRFVAENEGFNGLSKILIDKNNHKILGVHLLGNPASEIITLAAMAIDLGLTIQEWNKIVFPHPTTGEILKELL